MIRFDCGFLSFASCRWDGDMTLTSDCLISVGRKILQEILCSVTNNVVGVRLCGPHGPRPARTGVAWSVTGRGLLSPLSSLSSAGSLWSLVTTATTTRLITWAQAGQAGRPDGWCRPWPPPPGLGPVPGSSLLSGSGSGLWLLWPVWAGAGSPVSSLVTPHPVSVMTPG